MAEIRKPVVSSSLWCGYAAAANLLFALLLPIWLLPHYWHPQAIWWLADWLAVPCQLIALALAFRNWRRQDLPVSRRAAWGAILGFIAFSLLSTIIWVQTYANPRSPYLILSDLLYLFDYLLLASAFLLFVQATPGHRWPSLFWRDVATIAVAVLAAEWTFFFQPYFLVPDTRALNAATTAVYALVMTILMSVATATVIRLPPNRSSWSIPLLACAALVNVGWELAWVASKFVGHSYVGVFYSYGDVLCFSLIGIAAVCERAPAKQTDISRDAESNAYWFLPAVTLLIVTAILAGAVSALGSIAQWMQIVLIVLGGLLLISRQEALRHEVARLHRQLAMREADARVVELIEQSRSLLLIIDSNLAAVFASPAMCSLLKLEQRHFPAPQERWWSALGRPALLSDMIGRLRGGAASGPVEITLDAAPAGRSVLLVSGIDQRHNTVIGGIVLSFVDVTAHRSLEREVVAAGARERLRLASEVHEGLGQELTGIALMLRHVASRSALPASEWRSDLDAIVKHVNCTIEMARQLAQELAPISIARGSLAGALERLARETVARAGLPMEFEAHLPASRLDEDVADHLYRIAREAINNATRHSQCSWLRVVLAQHGSSLVLEVRDNGRGFCQVEEQAQGFGLRIMRYRARIIGASFMIDASREGTSMRLELPLR